MTWEETLARLEEAVRGGGDGAMVRKADIRAALERVETVEGAMRADDKRLEDAAIRVWGEHRWGCDTPDQMADLILSLRQRVEELEREIRERDHGIARLEEWGRGLTARAEASEAKLAKVVKLCNTGQIEPESAGLILAAAKGE